MEDEWAISWTDWEFADVFAELQVLEGYLELGEKNLPSIEARAMKQLVTDEYTRHIYSGVDEKLITRFWGASIVMASWAAYESAAVRLANELSNRRPDLKLRLSDLSGDNLPKRLRKYFVKVAAIEFHSESDYQRLLDLYELRNILAHGNGQLVNIKSKTAWAEEYVSKTDGLEIVEDCIIIESSFARESYQLVARVLHDLMDSASKP